MKHPFSVGDKIVCISKFITERKNTDLPQINKVYVVIELTNVPYYPEEYGVHLVGMHTPNPFGYWTERFRKLDDLKKKTKQKQESYAG